MKNKAKNKKSKTSSNTLQLTRNIVPKSMAKTRSDVLTWKNALNFAENIDNPKMFPYYNLVKDMSIDAHLTSQIQNRKLKTISTDFVIKTADGKTHEELTDKLQKSVWFNTIIEHILDSIFFGYTLIELNRDTYEQVPQGMELFFCCSPCPPKGAKALILNFIYQPIEIRSWRFAIRQRLLAYCLWLTATKL